MKLRSSPLRSMRQPATLPTVTIDLSKSVKGTDYGFSGHPHETHLEFISHRMLTIILPDQTTATFEVGLWQFFQRNRRIAVVNLFSPAMDLDNARKLADEYVTQYQLPAHESLDRWRKVWDTPEGKSKQLRAYINSNDEWSSSRLPIGVPFSFQVSIRYTSSGGSLANAWTVMWTVVLEQPATRR